VEQAEMFHFDKDKKSFEDLSQQNGQLYWFASDLMVALGYDGFSSFKTVINRALSACTSLNIDIFDNFTKIERTVNGKNVEDYKLSRFACYLIAMNGDPKRYQVAQAQAYFIAIAETYRNSLVEYENIERVLIRDEISEREKSLGGVASKHGVVNYPLFQNAGYRGMYNKNLSELKKVKGLDGKDFKRSLLDFMGKDELAANLFRVTQTELKIKNENILGQKKLEVAAETVGREVRKTMIKISNTRPEDLSLTTDIKIVKSTIKETHKKFTQIDKKK